MGFSVPSLLRFEAFEVDLRASCLGRDGVKIRLREQPFKVLTAAVLADRLRRCSELGPFDDASAEIVV